MNNDKNVRKILHRCGVPQHVLGYEYLVSAINAVAEDPTYLRSITKTLYPFLAKKHGSTTSRVERAIRHAVELSFNNIQDDVYTDMFGYSVDMYRGRPTNAHFIAACVEAVKIYETD